MAAVVAEPPAVAELETRTPIPIPTPTPGGGASKTPTPTPTPTPGSGGGASKTPTPTPGSGASKTPTPTPTPAGTESEVPTPAGGASETPTPAGGESEAPTTTLSLGPAGGLDKKCVFCKIGNKEESVDLLHWDEQFACFRDIRPGAPHHYLVVPRQHIVNCKYLKKEHISIVQKMVNIGKSVLQQKGVSDLADVRLGFHWPPFCTITHLHLHVLAPASQMGFISRMVYRSNSYWFITVEQLIERLKSLPEDYSDGS